MTMMLNSALPGESCITLCFQQSSAHFIQQWQNLLFAAAQMVTTAVLSMILLPLLWTTPSRSCFLVLLRTGVQSMYLCHSISEVYWLVRLRCTALPKDLDGAGGCRTRDFTDLLCETLDSDQLWDNYGIDDDIVMCASHWSLLTWLTYQNSLSQMISLMLTFMRWSLQISFTSWSKVLLKNIWWRVSCTWTWDILCKWDTGWHRPPHSSCSTIPRSLQIFWRALFQAVDGRWFKGTHEGMWHHLK